MSPVGVPVAHGVMARVLLVLLHHLEADPLDAAVLRALLVAALLAGGHGGRRAGLADHWTPITATAATTTNPLFLTLGLGGLCDGGQQAGGKRETCYLSGCNLRIIS